MTSYFAYFAGIQLGLLGLVVWLIRRSELRGAEEIARLTLFAESAMTHLIAKNLEEKIQADSLKDFQHIQLQKLKDVQALEQAKLSEKKKEDKREKVWKTTEGQEISSKEYEIVS